MSLGKFPSVSVANLLLTSDILKFLGIFSPVTLAIGLCKYKALVYLISISVILIPNTKIDVGSQTEYGIKIG